MPFSKRAQLLTGNFKIDNLYHSLTAGRLVCQSSLNLSLFASTEAVHAQAFVPAPQYQTEITIFGLTTVRRTLQSPFSIPLQCLGSSNPDLWDRSLPADRPRVACIVWT
jgi:hypothetical protein